MYVNYPHDAEAQHVDTAQRALEADQTHIRIQRGSVTLNLTANANGTANVTFNPIFSPSPSPTPDVYLSLANAASLSAKLNFQPSSITNTGFTLQAFSDATQTVMIRWLAIGKAE